jgi:hypothetical protein
MFCISSWEKRLTAPEGNGEKFSNLVNLLANMPVGIDDL